MGELRETLRVVLACGSSTRQAASALHMHRNTVLYRLRRIEELIGWRITDRRPTLEVALNLAHMLGEDVLLEQEEGSSDMLPAQ